MSKESDYGYKGKVLEALRSAGCEVGDVIKISDGQETYEGILIPRSETNDEKHIVVKLKNGYNVGLRVTASVKVERVGKGSKPTFVAPPLPPQKEMLPKVVIMSTGGTIASRVDYRTGAVRSAISASDLYGVVPELASIAQVDTQILFSLYSENIMQSHWKEITLAAAKHIEQGAKGIVVAHGTDTMAYTAAALSFTLQNLPVPVILVGAQRSSDRPSSDAATNLISAVRAAAHGPFAEVVIAMHETMADTSIIFNRGTKVRKCHTSRRDTFRPVNSSPIARATEQDLTMLTKEYRKRDSTRKLLLKPEFSKKVALVKFYPGLDPSIIDWYAERDVKGLLLEGTGLGHVSKTCYGAIQNAIHRGILVALSSQCIWGRVNMNVYDTGRDLLSIGVVSTEDMFPETALVKLMWIFGQTHDIEEAKKLLKTNIAGEFSPRTLPQDLGIEKQGE